MDQKIKILLVESNTAVRLFFTDIFWLHALSAKFDLFVSDGVESAEKYLTDPEKKPDYIFVDLVMTQVLGGDLRKTSPEVGLDFISRVKKDPLLKNTKVIIYSSYPEEKYGDLARKRGADRYIYKSENLPQDIVEILNDLHAKHVPAKND
jgi:CheY-like chemotaxis protein